VIIIKSEKPRLNNALYFCLQFIHWKIKSACQIKFFLCPFLPQYCCRCSFLFCSGSTTNWTIIYKLLVQRDFSGNNSKVFDFPPADGGCCFVAISTFCYHLFIYAEMFNF